VRQGRFHIFAVTHVDQAMELLTGVSAGTPDAKGEVAEDSVNGRIMAQLLELAQQRHGPAEKPKAPRKSKAKEAAPAHPVKEPVQDVSGRPEAGEGGNAA